MRRTSDSHEDTATPAGSEPEHSAAEDLLRLLRVRHGNIRGREIFEEFLAEERMKQT